MSENNNNSHSQTDSDATYCPEYENAIAQDKSPLSMKKSRRYPKRKKFKQCSCPPDCQDATKLQKETLNILNSYKKKKESCCYKSLEAKRNEIANIIKNNNVHQKSLSAFKKKLFLFDMALKERKENGVCHSKSNDLNTCQICCNDTISLNSGYAKLDDHLTIQQPSVLILEETTNEIEILDTSQIVTESNNNQLDINRNEIICRSQPLNLCLRNLNNEILQDTNKSLEDNGDIFEMDTNEDEFNNPIDLSLKTNYILDKINKSYKILNEVNTINNITKEKTENHTIIRKTTKTVENINHMKNIDNFKNNPQSPLKVNNINENVIPIPLINSKDNEELTKNNLCETDFEAIKIEMKRKINEFFGVQLNDEKFLQNNSDIAGNVYEKECNKDNIPETEENENIFENLWSQTIKSPSQIQTINYNNELKEIIDQQQNVYNSDGTDTNHIDIDFSINSNITPLLDNNLISCYNTSLITMTPPKAFHCDVEKNLKYTLSDKHILRLALALNLNVDYLKTQIQLCLHNEYTFNNYDFDDISVIGPSQSPLNIHNIRNINRNQLKIYKNLNISNRISDYDIGKREKISNKRLRKKLKKIRSKRNGSEILTNFSKR